ncbi:MAG: PD40 domain-containing protein [Candidatus Eisenbacteria bacterium]|nr:PD40 domain-containing protein [Candidatus Eisenbacteria bacterium]
MRIWSVARDTEGWQAPEALDPPVFSGANEWGSSLTSDGTLYFCSEGDIYRAVTATDGTVTVENVGSPISSPQLEGAPCIAPDGSYLILESRRPGGYGSSDLYVSFHQAGAWTTPRNLGPSINSTYIEDGPFVSSDGKYLFFNRRRSAFTTEQSEIWWVDARAGSTPSSRTSTRCPSRRVHPPRSPCDRIPRAAPPPSSTLFPKPDRFRSQPMIPWAVSSPSSGKAPSPPVRINSPSRRPPASRRAP